MAQKSIVASIAALLVTTPAYADPLPSWANGESKKQIVDFENFEDPKVFQTKLAKNQF